MLTEAGHHGIRRTCLRLSTAHLAFSSTQPGFAVRRPCLESLSHRPAKHMSLQLGTNNRPLVGWTQPCHSRYMSGSAVKSRGSLLQFASGQQLRCFASPFLQQYYHLLKWSDHARHCYISTYRDWTRYRHTGHRDESCLRRSGQSRC